MEEGVRRMSSKYASREAWERAGDRMERRIAADYFRVPIEEMDKAERFEDYRNDQIVYRLGDRQMRISPYAISREIGPPPDPMLEAFSAVALALHESEKRQQRYERDLWRFLCGWTRLLGHS